MNIFSLLAFTVYAAEAIISPLPDIPLVPPVLKPNVTFGELTAARVTGQVLGEATTAAIPTSTPLPAVVPPSGTKEGITRKRNVTIAVLGDSMVDTLGPGVPHLQSKLTTLFPTTHFNILNYGVGATNAEYGLERLTHDYTYLGNHIASLVSQHPDMVVVESFGYNPFSIGEGALDRHWLTMAKIIDVLKGQIPGVKIVIAATIAPNAKVFGDGAAGLSFGPIDKWQHVDVIKKYLDSTVRFAQSQHLPLANIYNPSLGSDGNGNLAYINPGDHIHYSDAGRELFAQKVTEAIISNHLLE